jgi:hypothetical protein
MSASTDSGSSANELDAGELDAGELDAGELDAEPLPDGDPELLADEAQPPRASPVARTSAGIATGRRMVVRVLTAPLFARSRDRTLPPRSLRTARSPSPPPLCGDVEPSTGLRATCPPTVPVGGSFLSR